MRNYVVKKKPDGSYRVMSAKSTGMPSVAGYFVIQGDDYEFAKYDEATNSILEDTDKKDAVEAKKAKHDTQKARAKTLKSSLENIDDDIANAKTIVSLKAIVLELAKGMEYLIKDIE